MALMVKKGMGAIRIDEGEYTAVVHDIKEGTGGKFGDGTFYIWEFKIKGATIDDEPMERPAIVGAFCSPALTAKSKLGKFVRACGIDLDADDDEIDLEECKGCSVRVTVADTEKEDGTVNSNVTLVRGPKKSKDGKKAKPVDDDDEEAPPPKKASKPQKQEKVKKAAPVEDDDDEVEDDEEDAPPPKKSAKPVKPVAKPKKPAKDEDDDDDDIFDTDDDDE